MRFCPTTKPHIKIRHSYMFIATEIARLCEEAMKDSTWY